VTTATATANIARRDKLERHSEISAADTALTLTTPTDPTQTRELLRVNVKYSAVPVHAGIIVTLKSGLGAAHDQTLSSGPANAQTAAFTPSGKYMLMPDDAIEVLAPAGGGVITSAVSVYTEAT